MATPLFYKSRRGRPDEAKLLNTREEVERFWGYYGHYSPGDLYAVDVAAPGIGRIVYEITRNDESGMWGRVVEANVAELDQEDVY